MNQLKARKLVVLFLAYGFVNIAVDTLVFSQEISQQLTTIRLTDISRQSGIHFVHADGGTGKRYIVESVVAGMATFDFDNDGYVDIYFVNGKILDGNVPDAQQPRNALYRNNGDFTFTDVTERAGVGKIGYGMGAVSADFDEDGDTDLYVSNFGSNVFYQNNGDGTFSDVSSMVPLAFTDRVGAGCAFMDIDKDGDLDLFVGNYVRFSTNKHIERRIGKYQFHPGPTDFTPCPDSLFLNNGDGSFSDASQSSGISQSASYTMGVVAFDADGDEDIDIMIANDQRPNSLWINDGAGKFEDNAVLAGVAFDRNGKANGNMGVDIGDVNSDGLMDILTTTYQDEMPVLYVNLGNGLFLDQTNLLQIDNRLHPHVTWGCGLVDFDNDGDLDIYVACGHFLDNLQHIDDRTSVKVRDFVLENRGGKFVDVTSNIGSGSQIVESSRATVFEDFDNDGDIDVVVLNFNASPSVLRNDSTVANKGVLIQLVGTRSNRSAIGSVVKLSDSAAGPIHQLVAGSGYQSGCRANLHLGLGTKSPQQLDILWPSGNRSRIDLNSHHVFVLEDN